jgi:hypothetical protein
MEFDAIGETTPVFAAKQNQVLAYSVTGTFTGSVALEVSDSPNAGGWTPVLSLTATGSGTYRNETKQRWYRLHCVEIDEEETVEVTLSREPSVLYEFKDENGKVVLQITDSGIVVTGSITAALTGNVTGSLAGTHTGNAVLASTVFSAAEMTETGTLATGGFVELNHETVPILASVVPTKGQVLTITQTDAGTAGHVVTTAGTFDGTNNTATFDAQFETLVLLALNSTRWLILNNNGSVGLSSVP